MLRALLRWLGVTKDGESRRATDGDTDRGGDHPDGSDDTDADKETDATDDPGDGRDGDDGNRRLWDMVPNWQYRGQYVQSGGDVADEQERALAEIQQQAEAIESQELDDQIDLNDGR